MNNKDNNQELFLFEEMKSGKEYAFDFFFNYYYPGLCIYAQTKFSFNEEDAKNLVQDVFYKLWNDRQKINIHSSVRSYLFISVKNRGLDLLKSNKSKIKFDNIDSFVDIPDNQFDVYVLSELEVLFKKSLDKLPKRCREIFELSRFEGLKNREIALKLELSEKTIENQMTKAIRILKAELKDYIALLLIFESFHFLK